MQPSFSSAGPCIPGEHYMLPPERRLKRVLRLIHDHQSFVLHGGPQTGKTTCLEWLEHHLNVTGRWRALRVDALCPAGMAALDDLELRCGLDSRPVVLILENMDRLPEPVLVSLLLQLREGYIRRGRAPFPASVAMAGQFNLREHLPDAEILRGGSPYAVALAFTMAVEATTLAPFTEEEVGELLGQHTALTGQRFEPAAVQRIVELGQGHPWLTNALADQIVSRDIENRSVAITLEHVEAAKEMILLERRSHIDSLVARLCEPRVRRILEPMLTGDRLPPDLLDEDLAYVIDLGLVAIRRGFAEIANPIYREMVHLVGC